MFLRKVFFAIFITKFPKSQMIEMRWWILSHALFLCLPFYQHDKPVKTCQWIQAPNYSCLMTGSWDNTVKFWDTRQSNPMMVLQIPERVYCADVVYPMAIVGTAQRGIICYQLENQPSEVKRLESPLKYQVRTKISVIWKMKKSNTRTLRKNSELQLRIKPDHRATGSLNCQRLYGEQGRSITTPFIEDCIGDLLKTSRPPAY